MGRARYVHARRVQGTASAGGPLGRAGPAPPRDFHEVIGVTREIGRLVRMGIRRVGAVTWTAALAAATVATLAAAPVTTAAQGTDAAAEERKPGVVERPLATRAELEATLDTVERRLASQTGQQATALERRAERIRERLRTGDFRVGDMVEMTVRGDSSLTGKFQVNREGQLELPTLPPVSLDGVLYSEVEAALREALGRYIRDPNVRARALWRVAVLGGVTSPGYYDFHPSTTLSEALMQAGGPSQEAKLDDLEFRRDGRNLLDDREAPVESLTLADLGARRGDQLFVPQAGRGASFMGVMGIVSGIAGTAWAITRVF